VALRGAMVFSRSALSRPLVARLPRPDPHRTKWGPPAPGYWFSRAPLRARRAAMFTITLILMGSRFGPRNGALEKQEAS